MKLGKLLQGTLVTGVACGVSIPHEKSMPVVKLSFDKHYGDSYENSSPHRLRKRTTGDVDVTLKNQQNFYSVNIKVGTPYQELVVLLDTGSSDMWVTGSGNPYCESSTKNAQMNESKEEILDSIMSWYSSMETLITWAPTLTATATTTGSGGSGSPTSGSSGSSATIDCSEYGTFNKNKSSTFKSNSSNFDISYGDGSFASGLWGTDAVSLAGLNISNVSFAVANETNSTVGVLGIGLAGLESTYSSAASSVSGDRHQYANFPMVLKERGYIKKNVYSLFLDNSSATSGSILFGAVDSNKYDGELYTIPILNLYKSQGVTEPLEFDVTLQGVGMTNGSTDITFTTTPIPALLDSGTTLAYLPEAIIDMMASSLDATYSDTLGYYEMPCPSNSDDTSIVFDFGGFHINAELSNLILESSGDTCVLGLVPSSGNSAILGDLFLVNAYVVYDLDSYEISLAQANYNSSSEDIQIVSNTVPNAKAAAGYSSTYSSSQSITSGGNIFTSSSTLSGSASNPPASSSSTKTKGSSSQNVAPSLVADSSSFLATIICAVSFLL